MAVPVGVRKKRLLAKLTLVQRFPRMGTGSVLPQPQSRLIVLATLVAIVVSVSFPMPTFLVLLQRWQIDRNVLALVALVRSVALVPLHVLMPGHLILQPLVANFALLFDVVVHVDLMLSELGGFCEYFRADFTTVFLRVHSSDMLLQVDFCSETYAACAALGHFITQRFVFLQVLF